MVEPATAWAPSPGSYAGEWAGADAYDGGSAAEVRLTLARSEPTEWTGMGELMPAPGDGESGVGTCEVRAVPARR